MIAASPIRSGCIVASRGPRAASSDPVGGANSCSSSARTTSTSTDCREAAKFLPHILAQTSDRDTVGELIEGDDVAHCIGADAPTLGQSRKPVQLAAAEASRRLQMAQCQCGSGAAVEREYA